MQAVGQLDNAEWLSSDNLKTIFSLLDGRAKIVGGAVRDTLRRVDKKITDIDIATPLFPEEVLNRMQTLDKNVFTVKDVGIKHGTITVYTGDVSYEITTLRADVETDGRHAEVEFIDDYLEDAKRRDFTFNALYADLDGAVYDPFGGIYDLSHGIVKFIGNPDTRIKEDYLRILRFFRFFAYYGYGRIDPVAIEACKKNVGGIYRLSAERIRDELFKIIMSAAPDTIFTMMKNAFVLPAVLPKAENIGALSQLVYLEGRGLMSDEIAPNLLRRLACLVNGDMMELSNLLKLSNNQKNELIALKSIKVNNRITEDKIKELFFKVGRDIGISIILMGWAKDRDVDLNTRSNKAWRDVLEVALRTETPEFPVRGSDLLAIGLKPSEEVGRQIVALKGTWMKSGFTMTKDELLAILKNAS